MRDAPRQAPLDAELFSRLREHGDLAAREQLVMRYMPLARKLARRYQHGEEPREDLVQVASVGLLKAVDRFETGRNVVFSSYAVPTILGELKRNFRDRTWSVRVPRDLQELALRVDRTVTSLALGKNGTPSIAEIASAVGASEEDVLEALQAAGAYRASSLDAPRSSLDEEAVETMADTLGVEEAGFEEAEQRATLDPLLAGISERERTGVRWPCASATISRNRRSASGSGALADAGVASDSPGACDTPAGLRLEAQAVQRQSRKSAPGD